MSSGNLPSKIFPAPIDIRCENFVSCASLIYSAKCQVRSFAPDRIEIVSEQYAENVLTRRTYVPGQTYRRTTDKTITAHKGDPRTAVASADKENGKRDDLTGCADGCFTFACRHYFPAGGDSSSGLLCHSDLCWNNSGYRKQHRRAASIVYLAPVGIMRRRNYNRCTLDGQRIVSEI
uniref:Uncharacterized protein n=1 Tax=Leclercia adecarboxylata TaxID=83655 RepID=A0A482M1G7_9ENTR|nr:Hypothetical protein [Leclercia adecarboxylata]